MHIYSIYTIFLHSILSTTPPISLSNKYMAFFFIIVMHTQIYE